MVERAGAVDVETATTEFSAAMLGWPLRTFEPRSNRVGWGWARFAFTSWTTLSWVTTTSGVASSPGLDLNVMVTGPSHHKFRP